MLALPSAPLPPSALSPQPVEWTQGREEGCAGKEDPLRYPWARRDRQEALPLTSLLASMALPASRAHHRHPQLSLSPSLVTTAGVTWGTPDRLREEEGTQGQVL